MLYLIQEDSAHTGKACIACKSISLAREKIFLEQHGLSTLIYDLGDERIIYIKISDEDFNKIKDSLVTNWNLFNSPELESRNKLILIDNYDLIKDLYGFL